MKMKQLQRSVWNCLWVMGCLLPALMGCHDADADIDAATTQGRRRV